MQAPIVSRPCLGSGASDDSPIEWQPPRRGPIPLGAHVFNLGAAASRGLAAQMPVQMPKAAAPARSPARRAGASASAAAQAASPEDAPRRMREVQFEFCGRGSLSVISSVTGRHYRFAGTGARLQVDARDVAQLGRVSDLKRL